MSGSQFFFRYILTPLDLVENLRCSLLATPLNGLQVLARLATDGFTGWSAVVTVLYSPPSEGLDAPSVASCEVCTSSAPSDASLSFPASVGDPFVATELGTSFVSV